MLRNCFLPVDYNKQASRTCGEIVYQNVDEFIITCTLCKIKIFKFDDFVIHLKNVHLEELVNSAAANVSTKTQKSPKVLNEALEEQEVYYCSQKIKSDVEEEDEAYYCSQTIKSEDEYNVTENKFDYNYNQDLYVCDDLQGAANDQLPDGDEEYVFSEEDALSDEGEEQEKRIMSKARKPKKLTDKRRLQMDVKIHQLKKTIFKCTYCHQSFAEECSLQNHVGHKHNGCLTCHKNFSSSRNLRRHMLMHNEVKAFVCAEANCGKAFASKSLLKDHRRYHSNQTFNCEECGYKCRQRISLIVHKRHHTGEKPFACKQCDSRFASKSLLKEHMATHETERKHVCDVCGKKFNRPKTLYHHKHLHSGIKKFVCKTCGAAYAQASGLAAHMRKH